MLLNYWWLLNIHWRSRWTFRSRSLVTLGADSFNLRTLNCLRLRIFSCMWNYWWFRWNYLLGLCMVLISTQSILAVYIFTVSFIKLNTFWIRWLQSLLNLLLFNFILGLFIRYSLSRNYECLRFLVYGILTMFGWNIIGCILFICIIYILMFVLMHLGLREFLNW